MTESCPNCAAPLAFDPSVGKLLCSKCGSSFDAQSIGKERKKTNNMAVTVKSDRPMTFAEKKRAGIVDGTSGNRSQQVKPKDESSKGESTEDGSGYYESYIYICDSCGSKVSFNSEEISTTCVYCGCPTVSFKGVSVVKKPKYIIPFKVSQDEAVTNVKKAFGKGLFVPKQIKNIDTTNVKGIYIPYWISDFDMDLMMTVRGTKGYGESARNIECYRHAVGNFKYFTNDASLTLDDELSQSLEPFYCKNDLVEFDESYLAGFYADASDFELNQVKEIAAQRAHKFMSKYVYLCIVANGKSLLHEQEIHRFTKNRRALLPIWFVTFNYKGKPHTILVNGQTGAVSGAVPSNKKLLLICCAAIFLAVCAASVFLFSFMSSKWPDYSDAVNYGSLLLLGPGVPLLIKGIKNILSVTKRINLTQSDQAFKLVDKRKGDI